MSPSRWGAVGLQQQEVGRRLDGHQAGLAAVEVLVQAGRDPLGRHGGGQLLLVAARAYHQPCPTCWLLQQGDEHCRLRTLGETHILSVFNQTHHLHARSIPQLEMPADSVRYGAEYSACELPVHHRYARGVCVVMPGEGSTRQ